MKNEKGIHVLYILTKLELGGAQKVCLTLMQGLRENGEMSSLISGKQGVLVPQTEKFDSVFLLKNLKREVGIKSIFFEFKAFFEIIKKIRALKKDSPNLIVHTHSTKAGIFGRWAALLAGVKTRIHTVHGFGFHEYQNKIAWITHYILEFCTSLITTHYICVSQNDQNIGKKLLPRFKNKSSIINAAVDHEKFYIPARKILNKETFIIGTVSCFKPQKNLFDLLKTFKLLCNTHKDKNLELQIIGDGILRKEIELWITENNLSQKIQLLGWQNDVLPWLATWNIFVMSSLWEGLPCSIVEARLNKLPVIAYNIAGIPEIIFDGKNGFTAKAGNWQELAKKIELLVLDKKLLEKISNFQDDLNNFSNPKMILQHLNLYKRLV